MSRGPKNRGGGRGPSGPSGSRPRGSSAGPSTGGCGFTIPLLPVLICLALIRAAFALLRRR